MSNPIAKVSLYRLDGELRGTVLRTYEGASLLPLGDHDVYAAPVTAANDQQNTQQLVAEVCRNSAGQIYMANAAGNMFDMSKYIGGKLYTAPPVPRDVLMAFGAAVRDAVWNESGEGWNGEYPGDKGPNTDIAAIAYRYASQGQPEPVNQQLLAAIEAIKEICDAEESTFNMTYGAWYSDCKDQKLPAIDELVIRIRAAIAAAEKGQGHD